eukprot:997107-Prymnesium_polylepis.1
MFAALSRMTAARTRRCCGACSCCTFLFLSTSCCGLDEAYQEVLGDGCPLSSASSGDTGARRSKRLPRLVRLRSASARLASVGRAPRVAWRLRAQATRATPRCAVGDNSTT